jgi:hypothetical protein
MYIEDVAGDSLRASLTTSFVQGCLPRSRSDALLSLFSVHSTKLAPAPVTARAATMVVHARGIHEIWGSEPPPCPRETCAAVCF